MHPEETVSEVMLLIERGDSNREIQLLASVPRATIADWRRNGAPGRLSSVLSSRPCPVCGEQMDASRELRYAHLLGLYLGDGCISRGARTFRLRVFLDQSYPGIIEGCRDSMESVSPGKVAHVQQHSSGACVVVGMYWNHWPCVFPQHGPGRKHLRSIDLESWQADIVERHPTNLIKGFIQSDGCRIVANDRGRESVRYHFSNRSEDIKAIYCQALDRLEIPWTRPCSQQIAVYRKAAAAHMDEFVGPKK